MRSTQSTIPTETIEQPSSDWMSIQDITHSGFSSSAPTDVAIASRDEIAKPTPVPSPRSPKTVSESGLSMSHLSDLLLKTLYVHGVLPGNDMARMIRLSFGVIEEPLRSLRDQKLVEVSSSDLAGRVSYRFLLTETGRVRAHEALDHNRYVGPAPVSLEQYLEHCQFQRIGGVRCNASTLRAAFSEFVIRPTLLSELGPALCTGRSIFLYGSPGNGKTTIAKGLGRSLSHFASEIYVPYAILIENSIVTLFDPGIHQTTDDADPSQRGMGAPVTGSSGYPAVQDGPVDLRWRRVKRPVVVTGSELTPDLLELKFNKHGNFYNAPLHIKANGGVFLVDDLGRQTTRSKDLINRWTVPLEEGVDYLTFANGRKCALPLEQLTIFATNLDPADVVDEAFLRRMKHKIRIDSPSRDLYFEIFQSVCRQQEISFDESVVNTLFRDYYDQGRTPRASDPRDLLELARSICRFHETPFVLSHELIHESARQLFGSL